MPVYIRKGPLEIPPGSERNWAAEDEEDYFLRDPNQTVDQLPQPYRILTKIVDFLIDQAWDIITIKEQNKAEEKCKAKISMCEPTAEIQIKRRVNCLAVSETFLFAGLSEGLGVYRLPACTWICGWQAADIEIYSLIVCQIKSHMYLIGTVDDMGIARLFCFAEDKFILLKVFNEPVDISKRTVIVHFKISYGGDYVGVLQEGNGECFLEVYRLPKDAWLKELEQSQVGAQQTSSANTPLALPARQATPSQVAQRLADVHATEVSEMTGLVPPMVELKFTPPLLLMKIKPPRPITGSLFKSPMEAVQKSEESSVFGTGQNHIISSHQWEQQEEIFSRIFQKYLHLETSDSDAGESSRHTMFHFLQLGILQGDSERNHTALPNAICVHWSGSHNLLLYQLIRPAKDKADAEPKPDTVWPCASNITCSAVSSCASFLALGLEDGTLTVWDIKYSGFPLTVVGLPEGKSIKSLYFLKCSTYQDPLSNRIPVSSKAQILVWFTDTSLYLVTAVGGKETNFVILQEGFEHSDDQISAVVPISSLPNLYLLFSCNGKVELMDVTLKTTVCQFCLPFPYLLASPWQPVFALDSENATLYIKGDEKVAADEILASENRACYLFTFTFSSLSLMSSITKSQQHTSLTLESLPWEQKCEVLLQNRLQTFSERRKQIAESWSSLRKHAADLTRQVKSNG
ncbi:WD repeat-containing protein 93 [Bombina bombina]|uniref:WD repeat-containing protein 93 n=1 Tax=Bombina bombina TaxID=8345 RepID=UPI00235A6CD7|nr:WD repeat-containing protein 93 [Bombina bombina]